TYKVTTSGKTSVNGPITIEDDKVTARCPEVKTQGNGDAKLDSDEELKCSASHKVVQADIDARMFTNTATAFGDGGNVQSNSVQMTLNTGIDFTTMKRVLKNYWLMLKLANALSGGTFSLPDLLYGFKVSRDPKAVGTSDPVYSGGNGRVVVGQADGKDFNSTTMIHEVNHDLDRSLTGTWGKHVANPKNVKDRSWGCDAGGPDLSWPYTGNDSIQEVGFDTTRPWDDGTGGHLSVLPVDRNDFMSYCWHKETPIQWISPYRWNAMFAKFTPPQAASGLAESTAQSPGQVYYISGLLDVNGSGNLDPIQVLPGFATTDIAPGEYSIEIQNGSQEILLSVPFMASFTDVEGVAQDSVFFSFQLPAQQGVAAILLKHNDEILDTIIPSLNPPTAELLEPGDGASWSAVEMIRWSASDADGDPLTFTLLYSPDEGTKWYPVASGLTEFEYSVDVARLPGGAGGKILLIVSDGFHTVQARSTGTFSVPQPAPIVVIETPADGQSFMLDEWIQLSGAASDLSGTAAGEFTYVWSVDGEFAAVESDARLLLEEGIHTVSLIAYDQLDNYAEASAVINVTANTPPDVPANPSPEDGATGVSPTTNLSWSGGDKDGDVVSYDVYLEAGNGTPSILVCDDSPVTSCDPPGDLSQSTLYYWRVVALDDKGGTGEGITWEFMTSADEPVAVIFRDSFE
ncbi:hypothetical protein ACFL3I_10240, partial [Pseudomonadota bacterium]